MPNDFEQSKTASNYCQCASCSVVRTAVAHGTLQQPEVGSSPWMGGSTVNGLSALGLQQMVYAWLGFWRNQIKMNRNMLNLLIAAVAVACIAWLAFPAAYRLIYYRPPYVRLTQPGREPKILKYEQALSEAAEGGQIEFFPGVYTVGKKG